MASTETSDFVLEKSDVTITQWVRLMQDDVMLAGLINLSIEDNGQARDLFVYSMPLNGFEIKAVNGRPTIKFREQEYPILSAKSRETPILVFSTDGIYTQVTKQENPIQTSSRLREFFEQSSSAYTEHQPEFTLSALVGAYQNPAYKKSIATVAVNHPVYRQISLVGVPDDSYHFTQSDKKIILNIWDQDFDVEAVTHTNGITVIADIQGLQAYCPKSVSDFKAAAEPSKLKEEDRILLQGIIDGDVECFAEYMEKNRSKFLKSIKYHGIHDGKAEDVLQDVQLKYLELVTSNKWKFSGTPDNAAAWIETVIKNRRLDILKGINRDAALFQSDVIVGSDGDESSLLDLLPAPDSDPAVLIEKHDFLAYFAQVTLLVADAPRSPLRHVLAHACSTLHDADHTQIQYALSQRTTPEVIKKSMSRGREALIMCGLSAANVKAGALPSTYTSFNCLRDFSL